MIQLASWSLLLVAGLYTLPSAHGQAADPAHPVCGPVCDIFCDYGNVLDFQGCPTCECNPGPAVDPLPTPPTPPPMGMQPTPPPMGMRPPPPPMGMTCPSGTSPVVSSRRCSSFRIRRFYQRCPQGSFCVPDAADGSGICCDQPVECRPVDPYVRCVRHWDQCNSDSDCSGRGRGRWGGGDRGDRGGRGGRWGRGDRGDRGGRFGRGGRCCTGPCGRQCQRPFSLGQRFGRRD